MTRYFEGIILPFWRTYNYKTKCLPKQVRYYLVNFPMGDYGDFQGVLK